ncbi:MAG: DUF3015 family protein [Wolinella sp.]
MKKVLGSVVLAGALASVAFAHPNTGCGLGSVVLKNQDTTLMQVLATTLNATSGNQTFGITSGTLNCQAPKSFASNDKINMFVGENMDALALDIANGQGESLSTLASLMNIEDKEGFAKKLQANFDNIYTSESVNSATVLDNIAKVIG